MQLIIRFFILLEVGEHLSYSQIIRVYTCIVCCYREKYSTLRLKYFRKDIWWTGLPQFLKELSSHLVSKERIIGLSCSKHGLFYKVASQGFVKSYCGHKLKGAIQWTLFTMTPSVRIFGHIYILGVFTERPYGKPLERNVVYIPITTSGHAMSVK